MGRSACFLSSAKRTKFRFHLKDWRRWLVWSQHITRLRRTMLLPKIHSLSLDAFALKKKVYFSSRAPFILLVPVPSTENKKTYRDYPTYLSSAGILIFAPSFRSWQGRVMYVIPTFLRRLSITGRWPFPHSPFFVTQFFGDLPYYMYTNDACRAVTLLCAAPNQQHHTTILANTSCCIYWDTRGRCYAWLRCYVL